jgi:hypothetical protein
VEAVACELVRSDIVPDLAGGYGLGQQVSDHVAELMLGSRDLLVSMENRREFAVMMPVGVVGDEGVGLQHGVEPLASVAGLVAEFGELLEMGGDLAFVPGS